MFSVDDAGTENLQDREPSTVSYTSTLVSCSVGLYASYINCSYCIVLIEG